MLWIFLLFCLTYGSCANLTKSFQQVNGTIIGNRTFKPADGPYLVTSELVVAQNATLTIEAGSEVVFVPTVGLRVHGSLHARGAYSNKITFRALPCNETVLCNNTNLDRFYNPGIRLVGGTSHSNGRLEIQRNGQWGTICNYRNSWDYTETAVACRQLGFFGAKRYYTYPGSGTVHMRSVNCNGKEETLWNCGYSLRSCDHSNDVGIECDTLMPLLIETVYWTGIYFAPTNFTEKQGNSTLENVDIVNAFEGIKALKKVPDLLNVTIKDGASGLLVKELENHIAIMNTNIFRSALAGANIESSGGDVVIENTTVQNTSFGDGFVYNRILDAMDLCSIVPDETSIPFALKAMGKAFVVNCSKVFRARPGRKLSVHFRSIAGREFELNVTDGSAHSDTLLINITDEYNGKVAKTASSSVLEFSFYSKGNSRDPANVEMIIVEDQGSVPSLRISNSTFYNNFNSGIEVYDPLGFCQISSTVASKNGGVGLQISGAHGRVHILSTVLSDNQNHGVHIKSMLGSVVLETVTSWKNQESGIVIESGILHFLMMDSDANENLVQGLYISNPLDSSINISNTKFLRNSGGQGIYLKDFSDDCQIVLSDITSIGNSENGALFEKVEAKSLNVTSSSFDRNTLHGVFVKQVFADNLNFQEISTSYNLKTGVVVSQGISSMNIKSWSSIGNQIDGFSLENQEGQLMLKDCYFYGNKRNGLVLVDSNNPRLQSAQLQNCSVLKSSRYGILFEFQYEFQQGLEDYAVTVTNSTIANNALGGCWIYPSGCRRRQDSDMRHRRIQLSFTENTVEGNQKFGLYIYGPEWYELTAVLANNEIKNNSGYALKVASYDNNYCSLYYSFPVNVRVISSTFIKNVGEYIVLVDCNGLPTKQYIAFRNNSFIENRAIQSFSSSYVRTKTQAVLAVKEGKITVEHNSFVNPLFPHEMVTLLKDHERVIEARENWWGSRDECKVEERIFHFGDRIELAQIQHYPFLDSVHSNNVKVHNGSRRLCFLQGNKLGGLLNQTVTLPKDSDTYQVVGDVIVLPNGILTIEENVTLEFPLKAVFIVFGQVLIKGTNNKRVKFIPKKPLQKEIRLVGSPNPWAGILEIWFNNGWLPLCLTRYRYESTIVCRQLGYEALSHSYRRYPSENETFLHNVRCDTDESASIMHCNKNNWIASSSCSSYVAYIRCKTPYWSGVHLTITPKKSDIRNVNIDYAGFAYRDDLSISGIALRVDLNKHNISGILVNNSAGIGVQMMYPDPFKVSPDIVSSTIANIEESGILLESPFLNLATTNIVNTKGYGFRYYYNWNPLNNHVFKIADMSVKKNINLCSGNDTFIDDSSIVYYLVVRTKSRHACKKVITIPTNYSVAMQLIHYDVRWDSIFHVYSGTNKTSNTLWDVHSLSWQSRPVWKTSSSSVLFESSDYYYHGYFTTVHFVLFLVKETDKINPWLTTPNLIISKSNFISNAYGGVYLGGKHSGHVQIQSSVVQDSPANGLTTGFSNVKNLNLFNCSFIGNRYGIVLSSFSGNASIENTDFSNSTSNALYIVSDGEKTVHFQNISVIHTQGFGIYLKGDYEDASIFATNSFFGWNKATSIYSDIRYARQTTSRTQASFKNCTFSMNQGPVINIDESPKFFPWEFEGSIFTNNTQNSVIMTTRYTDSSYSPGLVVRRNKFIFNSVPEKGVIYVRGGTKELVIDANIFEGNHGQSVFVGEQSVFRAPATIQNNLFKGNNNSNGGVLEIRRMENDVLILDNVFEWNEGLNVVHLHNENYVLAPQNLTFTNNSLQNNSNVRSFGCQVEISGLKEFKAISIHHNRFDSKNFTKELCVNITANSHTSIVNMSLNFWGYDDENQIKERIYDAEDNYERALAVFIPFFGSTGELMQGSNQMFAKRYLGGRISSSVNLWSKLSPYIVISDITVLPDAELTIHPGVELQFSNGVGMLILGALFVQGNNNNPVTFSLLKRSQTEISIPVRLVGGTFPWQGHLEVLHNGNWIPVCVNQSIPFGRNNAKVICGQLGYQASSSVSYVVHSSTSVRSLAANLNCNGNEAEINECPLSFLNLSRNATRQVALDCKGGTPWGNLRFLREFRNTSYPITSKLQHLKIEHCGEKHGKKVAALEMIQNFPEMNHVSILNCTAGGAKVLFPEREVYVREMFLVNTGGYGGAMLITKRNITLEKVTSMHNTRGLSFHELDGHWVAGISYGQVFLCDAAASNVIIKDRDLYLYLFPPSVRYLNLLIQCHREVKTVGDAGFALQLLVMKNVKSITINIPNGNSIIKFSSRDIGPLSRRRLIPWNAITVYFEGSYSSEVLLQVQRVELEDMPCTFERGNCGWRQYPGNRFRNVSLTSQWRWYDTWYGSKPNGIPDHTYLYSGTTGNYMWLGHRRIYGSYGAFSSPVISKESNYCSLEFYYRFWRGSHRLASLSVFIEHSTENSSTPLWSTSKILTYWKKKVIKLPQTQYDYSVVFLGYFYSMSSVLVDDMEFVHCNLSQVFTHRITESIIRGNTEQGISYTSTQTKKHLLRIERCKITSNGGTSSGAIHLNAANQAFELFNNYLADNRNGSIYSRIHYEESESSMPKNHIHGNTFDSNRGGALFLEGVTGPYLNVKVTNNYFSRNFAEDPDGKVNSVCRITNLRAHVQGNFFYNNVGQYAFAYSYTGGNATLLHFLNNTLYKNNALGLKVNYGVTILCNGAAEMHGNLLENPGNRYQISTTLQGIQVIVNATSNWWGESVANSIASLIMDKSKDYRLSLTVIFKPFVESPPKRLFSVSCPPEWIKDNELCFLYKGGSFRFLEAKSYCQSYGGNIIAMFSEEDKRLVEDLRREESRISSGLPPSLWTIRRDFISQSNKDNGVCSVLDGHGNITESQCDGLHPFLCVRRPVIHCPNGCFHNGDCIGAICFCYPGWTGEDCSRFHCHDLHNCSGNGECMGPNTCKCYPGYLGLGCTYSFCEKYESCSDCVTDPFCGWCDSSRSCLGGFAVGPPKRKCPDWFYYHCYTVGGRSRCSSNIPTVDCGGKQCNFRNGRGTTEACQKCQDLDKCYKIAQEEGECRSWNETRCPDGQVNVDYTDPERSKNVELAENVKFVEANTTVIYACPVIMAQHKEISLVFVAPKVLEVQVGDILCSPQAGGIMHKIVAEVRDGPFRVMMSAPAGLEEVIKYADFKKEASVEDVDDDSTLEDEPDEEDLEDIIAGNIRLNVSRIFVLPDVYKCLGHTYEIGNVLVHSYYLVMKKNLTVPKIGDIVASNVSGGFIETVVSVHKTNDTGYLETKFQRCNEYSQLNATRLKQSRRTLSQSVFCSGGDNNPGLVLSAVEESADRFAVNDSIVGRPSRGYMAKVVKVNANGDFLLVEVISTELNGNGTFSTAVDVNQLHSHHRRTRRSSKEIDLASFQSTISHKMLSRGNAKIQVSMSAFLSLTAFVEIESKWFGFGIKDASAGLKLEGGLDFSCDITVDGDLSYTGDLLVMKDKQLGSTKYIRLGVIKLPAGIFLGMTGQAAAAVSGTLRRAVSVSGRVSLGGECSWSEGSCYTTDNSISFGSHWSNPKPKLTGAKIDVTVTPTISVKVPAMPKRFENGAKRPSLNILDKIVVAVADLVDLSLSLYASVPLKAEISMTYPSSQCRGKTPAKIEGSYGISDLIFGVSVGFLKKQLRLSFNTGFSLKKWTRDCICPVSSAKICVGSSSKPPAPRPPIENPPKPPEKKKRKKKTGDDSNQGKNPGLECGEDYACAGRRMGPNCTQPDMYPNQECSGNGKPVILPRCKAECECFGGWEGEYCERISANGGGDPHLETLDGANFDFFGIGEFWGCKSVQNDFGLQFRFYYYERASLIGGVALKAGKSIVTVMTIKTKNPQDTPILRIDGMLINITSNSSKPIDINNGTVLLDRQRRFTFEAEENSVALISMQYDTGVTVTIDVRHSRVMKRQYLNVLYSPTAAYKGHTEGLCGFMDNNATNDFMGPDGVLYNDAVQFAESWRIKACHNGSGRLDSWSWNSSNFYQEDVMDVTYTDPSYIPVYSLDGIPNSLLEVATSMCKSLNISDNDLHSCIFDVAITNDTTFTDQETFKRDCPSQCSGKGRCVNGTCRCIEGWTGESCDKGSCLNCSTAHGKCVKGFCVCDLGWEGRSCELKAECHNVSNCTSPVHGVCKTTDVCQCSPGYIGYDCSVIPTCLNVSNCTGSGLCVDYDVCKCNAGWTGTNCTQYSCEHLDYCSEHGRCVALDECACDYGWTGASCALPDCSAVNQCSGKGECVASNLCRCYMGFLGASCSEVADCSEFANCSGRGVCVSTELLNVSCSCYTGFTGYNCSQPTCTTVNNCSNHGECIEAEFCKCDLGYNGTDCSNFSCEAVNSCSGNGECVGYDICRCNNSWSGPACSIPDCSSVNNCSARGDCILPDTCACYPAFDGKYCDQNAKPNTNSPSFDHLFYNATIIENSPVGTMIVQVHANDTDIGRNGQVFYTVVSDKEFDDRLAIGGTSGKLYSTSMLDFETIKKPSFNVAIVASDDGFPQKSGVTIVQITVVDENDNCPTFIEPSGNLQLEFSVLNPGDTLTKVSAVDLDSGLNSDITYSLSESGAFSIDPKTGVITVVSNLAPGLYHLTVSASDNGDVSCKTETSLAVKIKVEPTKEPLTSPASSSTQKIPETLTTQSDTESTSMSTQLTEPKVQSKSTAPGDEVTAAPQKSPNYVLIGGSAAGGVLMIVIIAVVIRKCLCKTRTSSAKQPRSIGKVNECLEGDLELSNMSGKI